MQPRRYLITVNDRFLVNIVPLW